LQPVQTVIPSRPTAPGPSRPPIRNGRKVVEQPPSNCLCNKPFEKGGFKSAHELKCTEANGVCYPGLDPKTYNNKDFVALIIKDKLDSNSEIIIPVADMWESTVNEIVRQLSFLDKGLSVDIPIVILEFTSGVPALIISKNEFYDSFYTEESTIKECPAGLKHIILIMERIKLPGPNFNVIDLASRLVIANVFSGDFKAGNAGMVGDNSVLIDWDPKFQFDINPKIREADRSNLVCYMVLTFLMELIDYMVITSNDIYAFRKNTELTAKLTDSNQLFLNTREKFNEYYPSIFTKDDSGRKAILRVIESARKVFDKKPIDMFLNLLNYDPVHNIQLLLYKENKMESQNSASFYFRSMSETLKFTDKVRKTDYNLWQTAPNYTGRLAAFNNYFTKYIPFDINCLLNMTFTDKVNIEDQIKKEYISYIVGKGGSRKRPKTKRRRSHKKKKRTRKMFR
jgi:hypothetical protein